MSEEKRKRTIVIEGDIEHGDEIYEEETCKTMFVEPGHFLFWPCKCGDPFGRHYGILSEWPYAGHCYDCGCQKFDPKQPLEEWQRSVRERLEMMLP